MVNKTYMICVGVGGKLCLLLLIGVRTLPLLRCLGITFLPFSKSEIDQYKVPSKYTRDFLGVLYVLTNLCSFWMDGKYILLSYSSKALAPGFYVLSSSIISTLSL
jgi:hypothetical protein